MSAPPSTPPPPSPEPSPGPSRLRQVGLAVAVGALVLSALAARRLHQAAPGTPAPPRRTWAERADELRVRLGSAATPASAEELLALAQAHLERGPQEEAQGPRRALRLQIGRTWLRVGRPEVAANVARRLFTEAVADAGLRTASACLLGDALWAQDEREQACEVYAGALKVDPHLAEAAARLALQRWERGDPQAAWDTYERYRDAPRLAEAGLFVRLEGETRSRGPLRFPVRVDGERHTYRVDLGPGVGASALGAGQPKRVTALVFNPVAAAGVRVRLESLRLEGAPGSEGRARVLLEASGGFPGWGPKPVGLSGGSGSEGALIPASPRETGPALGRACELPPVGEWGALSVRMRLEKPYPALLLRVAGQAAESLGVERLGGRAPEPTWPRLPGPAEGLSPEVAVVGHTRSLRPRDPSPDPEVAAGIASLTSGAQALVVTGDATWSGLRWGRFRAQVRTPASCPLLFAVGNHDVLQPGDRYRGLDRQQMPTSGAYRLGSALLVLLDSEREQGTLDPRQLEEVCETLSLAGREPGLTHVLVFVHRVLWLSQPRYDAVRRLANTSSRQLPPAASVAWRRLADALQALRPRIAVGVFAGDLGSRAPLLVDEVAGVLLVASGLAGVDPSTTWWNHGLRARLEPGRVGLTLHPFGSQALGDPRAFDLSFWEAAGTTTLSPATLPR